MSPQPGARFAAAVADRLAEPSAVPAHLATQPWWRQSVAHGAPGIALLHIERAAAGDGPWQRAHDWIAYAADKPVTTGADSHLFYGGPALAHAMACAADGRPGAYGKALAGLDQSIAATTGRRLDDAHARLDRGDLPALAEFDVIRGLTGMGAYLLRRGSDEKTLRQCLEYLVRLTEPVRHDSEVLPGWWTLTAPSGRRRARFAGGHANSGMAHGIAGPLALLALACLRGVSVHGHREAIGRICGWLDRWRTRTPSGEVWPYWVNRAQYRAGRRGTDERQPPSWCYGTAGLARAQQLGAMALADAAARTRAEQALADALESPTQQAATTDGSLCHGHAGLAHLAATTAADAEPGTGKRILARVPSLLEQAQPADAPLEDLAAGLLGAAGPGFLEGAVGTALAAAGASPPLTGWDTCLLIR
ncbi:lanthionine synthetase C family protein [Streptomyces sp. DSM 42041]|uniref:Lanthionine synthetase C family protein n=1 Tax=Streptomyces hazeniae TaxID=3075538 RepID=A0ABU2NPM8_9ACTN|nr:lanthionine synthetase C family protein [Streptomyces sp. DSM 42041]MDT0378412.1 lanthionine synthetase C family protein [Streptomyces sp. DSM 42041]